jgi:hypothetical protein
MPRRNLKCPLSGEIVACALLDLQQKRQLLVAFNGWISLDLDAWRIHETTRESFLRFAEIR